MTLHFARQRLAVLGVIRNGGDRLAPSVLRLAEAFGLFDDVRWFVVESDSDDDTVQTLQSLTASVAGFRFVSLGRLREQIPLRTARIAHVRNRALEELESASALGAADIVAVVDLDGLNDLLTRDAVATCMERDDWSMVAANQRAPYYDVFALRHPLWSPNDAWAQFHFLVARGMRPATARAVAVHARMLRISEAGEWIEVQSAFGGLALYRRAALHGLRYVGLDAVGAETCEHVALNLALSARGGRLFVNPRLVNAGPGEHVAPLALHRRLVDHTADLARALARGLVGERLYAELRRLRRAARGTPS